MNWGGVSDGVQEALRLIVTGDPLVVATTVRTLRLGVESTTIAAAAALPLGLLLGIGRFRGRRAALAVANALTKVPPVVVGVFAVLLLTPASPYGGGPLAGLNWQNGDANGAYFVQTLLAFPIIVALTATAVQAVAPGLLEQARAFGAPAWRCGLLALREARAAVLAGVVLALGVTITAVGALLVIGAPTMSAAAAGDGSYRPEPASLALGAVTAYGSDQGGFGGSGGKQVAVAYATVLFGLFFVIAATLTALQHGRGTIVAGRGARVFGRAA